MFGKSFHQQEYKVLRKGHNVRLDKQHISNLFNSQEALGNILPLLPLKKLAACVIERYKLPFTMIVRVFQIHQHYGPHTKESVAVGQLLPRQAEQS